MSTNSLKANDPFIRAIEIGLKSWIRSKCKSLGTLTLVLRGSSLELLRGRLLGLKIVANKVNFQGLYFHRASLESGPIQIKFNLSLNGKKVNLANNFELNGSLSLKGNDLSRTLISDKWKWLGDLLADQLLGIKSLENLIITNDMLEIEGKDPKGKEQRKEKFRVDAFKGNLRIKPLNNEGIVLLPMDPSIQIDNAKLLDGELLITGRAKVSP